MDFPLLNDLKEMKEVIWYNNNYTNFSEVKDSLAVSYDDVLEALERLERFASYIKKVFPEVIDGIIESPVSKLEKIKIRMENEHKKKIYGDLILKRDDLLPIAGSIKARGGIYEVLKYAETLAMDNGLLELNDDYSILASDNLKEFFSSYTIQVGSTGNLGLSIGTISAKLGFNVIVHMSQDAKQWKKDLLRSRGVEVVEYESDYSKAVEEGRALSDNDPKSYFIDDENSKDLFMGYAVAGLRTKKQLDAMGIVVDVEHPLLVYLPCGVGGGPGGVAYGLKLMYGDNVHCFFAEPTHSPAMLLGLASGLHDKVSVEDIGLDNKTAADGLAVGRPSSFVGKIMDKTLTGAFTIDDHRLYDFLKELYEEEKIFLEPSALAGLLGPIFTSDKYQNKNITHMCWGTGGSLVPDDIRKSLINKE
ncbi:D-serine ammonia-lyase [Tissierella sp.]|uniref:D-serine ammonia-lyase n=1 Tax=Tissierella sp. TaxID=41274 RepID=UPI00285F885F|nr:D-serine ammonia-lyase [Tissierella sp.]MDR7855433.1 D-serine ammonia-lyase [Tissierella sp.]